MVKKKLDVLVTFYNQEKYVDRALSSILSQKCGFEYNILVGDDGSTDGTVSKIIEWKHRYPEMIEIYSMPREVNKKHVGGFRASQNRLNLTRKVLSEYFVFLDGDDYYTSEEKFQKQIDVLENDKNKDCIGCAHQINATFPDGTEKIYGGQPTKEGKYGLDTYWYRTYFHTDTIIFRSKVIEKIPYKLLENNYNDNMITYFSMQYGTIYYLSEVMVAYDQTGEGIWTGEKRFISNLRNMFLYDLCNQMNPAYKKQSNVRFASSWRELFDNRKSIDVNDIQDLCAEAIDKRFNWSLKWIESVKNNNVSVILLRIKYMTILFDLYLFKVKNRLSQILKSKVKGAR